MEPGSTDSSAGGDRGKPAPRSRLKGEPQVWLCGLGLTLGIIMVVSLLGVIVAKGLEVFWPDPVAEFRLNPGSGEGAASKVTGQFVQEREKAGAHGTGEAAAYEWQIFTGNRDVYGAAFQFVDAAAVADQSYPDGIAVAERRENGNAIFYPVALRLGDGTSLDAGDAAFAQTLGERMERAGELREQIEDLIKGDVGAINRQMRSLDLRLKANPGEAGAIESERAALQAEYEKLTAEAAELEEQLLADVLAYRLPTGEEGQIAVGDLFAFYYPNQMGFWEKVGWFFSHLWRFLSDDPREANMEGGVYPAIFGTFAMTVIMSAFVTPLGVIAAIYLREYAKQGPLVRAVRISVNNLAGVPSIVFGVFGLGFFVYLVGGAIDEWFFADALPEPTFGTGGILWASLTLALLTLPVVIVATEEALGGIPRGIREAALACGASKWQTIQRVVLPGAIPGILTGVILAMARGAGEVAPLMLVGVMKLAPALPVDSVFPFVHPERKFMHLGFHIYDLGFQSPDSEAARPMLFATTLLLITLVVVLNLGAIMIRNRLRKKYALGAF